MGSFLNGLFVLPFAVSAEHGRPGCTVWSQTPLHHIRACALWRVPSCSVPQPPLVVICIAGQQQHRPRKVLLSRKRIQNGAWPAGGPTQVKFCYYDPAHRTRVRRIGHGHGEQTRGPVAGTWASCLGCRQLAVWLRGRAWESALQCPRASCPITGTPQTKASAVVPVGELGALGRGTSVLRSKPPSHRCQRHLSATDACLRVSHQVCRRRKVSEAIGGTPPAGSLPRAPAVRECAGLAGQGTVPPCCLPAVWSWAKGLPLCATWGQ